MAVSVLYSHFPPLGQALVETFSAFIGFCIGGLITWQTVIMALGRVGEFTDVLHIPVFPIKLIFAFGFTIFSLELLIQFVDSIHKVKKTLALNRYHKTG